MEREGAPGPAAAARPRIVIALYADLTHDRRVQREAVTLSEAGYAVTILALGDPRAETMELVEGIDVFGWNPTASEVVPGAWSPFRPEEAGSSADSGNRSRLGWAVGYGRNLRSWGRWAMEVAGEPDMWHAVDFTGLVGLWTADRSTGWRCVYDSHELFLESGSAARMPQPMRWLLARLEGRLARRAAGVVTVNDSIARQLAGRYGVDPVVVMNCPLVADVVRPGRLRERLALGDRPVLLHHGSLSDGRGIANTVDALRLLPKEVALVLLGDGPLVPWIQAQQRCPELVGRLYHNPAVPLSELLSWVVDADVGVMLFEPSELNFMLATPNRLFDCIAAGVPVLASDFPEFRGILVGGGIGDVCDPTDPGRIAEAMDRLLASPERRAAMSTRARAAARATYNWDAQALSMVELYRRILPVTTAE